MSDCDPETVDQRSRLPTRGWGPWRQDYYTLSSNLRAPEADPAYGFGVWRNRWAHNIDGLVWRFARPVALWWHNRPNSKTRRTLERFFPNLRR